MLGNMTCPFSTDIVVRDSAIAKADWSARRAAPVLEEKRSGLEARNDTDKCT